MAAYTKAIFLNEDPDYLLELADIYEGMLDMSTALNLNRRAEQLRGSENNSIKKLALLKGFALLDVGSISNILADCEHQEFKEKYPAFRGRLEELARSLTDIRSNLLNCLSYLECDYRMFAMEELQACLQKLPKQIELVVMHAFLKWSITKMAEGYKIMWQAY